MNMKLNTKVSAITVFAALLIAGLCAATLREFQSTQATIQIIDTYHSALRNHLECDMMHDALRADVLAALRAGAKKSAEESKAVGEDIAEHSKLFRTKMAENEKLGLTGNVQKSMKAVDEPLNKYINAAEEIVRIGLENPTEAEGKMDGFIAQFRELEEVMSKLSDELQAAAKDHERESAARSSAFFNKVYTLSSLALVALTGLTVLVVRSIPRPFRKLADSLVNAAEKITASSEELAARSQDVADSAGQQAASLEETSASLEEMSSMTKRNSDNSAQANSLSAQTRAAAEVGMRNMTLMREAMMDIKSASDNIGRIIKSIDEIAFQTNILALNAAVEAARAGESGMGFAVVADEVRTLAQRSAMAANETGEKIEDCIKKSNRGVEICEMVAKSLQEITNQASSMDALVGEISTASREQSVGISQINIAVAQMDKATQSNAESAANSASGAQALNEQSRILRETVSLLNRLVAGSGAETLDPNSNAPQGNRAQATESKEPEGHPAAGRNRLSAHANSARDQQTSSRGRSQEGGFPMPNEPVSTPSGTATEHDFKNF
jgi:methyl-accepting chemotaxis protein